MFAHILEKYQIPAVAIVIIIAVLLLIIISGFISSAVFSTRTYNSSKKTIKDKILFILSIFLNWFGLIIYVIRKCMKK